MSSLQIIEVVVNWFDDLVIKFLERIIEPYVWSGTFETRGMNYSNAIFKIKGKSYIRVSDNLITRARIPTLKSSGFFIRSKPTEEMNYLSIIGKYSIPHFSENVGDGTPLPPRVMINDILKHLTASDVVGSIVEAGYSVALYIKQSSQNRSRNRSPDWKIHGIVQLKIDPRSHLFSLYISDRFSDLFPSLDDEYQYPLAPGWGWSEHPLWDFPRKIRQYHNPLRWFQEHLREPMTLDQINRLEEDETGTRDRLGLLRKLENWVIDGYLEKTTDAIPKYYFNREKKANSI